MSGGFGLKPWEEAVMDAADAGMSVPKIAQTTGYSERSVRRIVDRYRVTGSDPGAAAVRSASAALLAAIRRHHPDVVRSA